MAQTMTWNPRRKAWVARGEERPRLPAPPPVVSVEVPPSVQVPPYPAFSPASIAGLLQKNRSTVAYWMQEGKLSFFRDNIGEPYIHREELVRFLRDYLHVEVKP